MDTVIRRGNMYPEKGRTRDYGNKLEEHVPEKGIRQDYGRRKFEAAPEKGIPPGLRSQKVRSCVRKRDPARITVAESSKLRPKKGSRQDYGRRKFEAAPEKGIPPELRSQKVRSCARKRDPARITVAESSKLRPKKGSRQDYGRRKFEVAPEKGIPPRLRSQKVRSCTKQKVSAKIGH
jgi:hypothetical protein